jgi:hypothetical protein
MHNQAHELSCGRIDRAHDVDMAEDMSSGYSSFSYHFDRRFYLVNNRVETRSVAGDAISRRQVC